MSDDTDTGCTLCGLPADGVDVANGAGESFCCTGCRDVYTALDDVDDVTVEDVRRTAKRDAERPIPDGHETTYLEVEGMYCSNCEAFIESVAANEAGVSNAAASYVTETVRIDHDPELSAEQLRTSISGLGYTAYERDDAFRRRQADNWATARLAVGVLVGMMVMLQYIVIIYPTYFGGLYYDERTAAFLADALASPSATYFYAVIGVLTTVVLAVTGRPILRGAYVSLKTRSPNMDLLVALAAGSAYAYSTLSMIVGGDHIYYDVTVAIIVIVTIGTQYESSMKQRATEQLSDLTAIQLDEATRLDGGERERVAVDELEANDRVLVRAGERVPIDGTVVDGDAAVDEAVVTGESLPSRKTAGDEVVGGSMVADGAITVRVGEGATSSLDRIAELTWDLQSGSRGIQKLADRLATIFVPLVLVLAIVVTAINLGIGATIAAALLVGLTVLIVSCPCALGLATPLAVAAGLRDALERSIVVFDDTVFERIREADTVVFDKTGTLTTGEMALLESDVDGELLSQAAELETRSSHPVATAIAAAEPRTDGGAAAERIGSFESHRNGVSGIVDGEPLLVGHPELFAERGWDVPERLADRAADASDAGQVPVLIGREGTAEGIAVVGDELRDGWESTVASLSADGVDVVVLTGDDSAAAERFRAHDGVSRVFAGVPPEGKAETVNRLKAQGRTVMVGDGTNDAPALSAADLGIALGGGTAMAVDAADVAIVDDDLASVETVFELSRATGRRIKGNIGWAFCYNAIAIPLAATGLLNPLFAAVAMGASSILVVTNSSRPLLK